MKYLVIEIQKYDSGAMSTPTYAYDNQNSAEAKYHSILASAAVSALPVHSAVLMNEAGFVIKNQSYSHIPEPEPEAVEETGDK